jgi:DNA-binding GntR family transcriptional regulator
MLTGELGFGSRLEEPSLARELGTSRAPVREAIRQLESEGLVRQVPRLGAFIPVPDRQELRDIIETRHALEVYAAARAAERITPAQVADLGKIVREFRAAALAMREASETDLSGPMAQRMIMADVALHAAIFRIAGNRRAAKIVGDLRLAALLYRFRDIGVGPIIPHLAATLRDHHRIYQAIRRHDAEAASKVMSQHLMRGDRVLLELDEQAFEDLASGSSGASGAEYGGSGAQWPDTYDRLIAAQQVAARSGKGALQSED